MGLESWLQGMADNSLFARVMRKSTAKAAILGYLDAIQNPNAVLADIASADGMAQDPQAQSADKARPPASSNSVQPTALPRPMLLSMPSNEAADEPDRPGVPPKKVRKQKKGSTTNGEAQTPPADASPGNVPE